MMASSMLLALLLAAQIGAVIGNVPIMHSTEPAQSAQRLSYKGWVALRLENVRLRHRLAKTLRQADECAVVANECGERLERVNIGLRRANTRLRQKPGAAPSGGHAVAAKTGAPVLEGACVYCAAQ
jgi:hypothetical protein